MGGIYFNAKIITDSVHGSIGISELEQKIINTRTFQRLKKIKHLGLTCLVFPAAEHTRFAHSIGVLHVMSQMIEKLKEEGCEFLNGENNEREVQKLRLAALLHDIGHYPLSHPGEQVFQWVDFVQSVPELEEGKKSPSYRDKLLLNAENKNLKSNTASHERLGKLIITHKNSEIREILLQNDFDPNEIARIFNAEDIDNPFYTQLMSSTLDCDRMDYMLRDAKATGTNYGMVDFKYILRNLKWDKNEERICFTPKAITSIEHFITSRYFSYNIIYHKTTLGFELMAKALFFTMIMDNNFKAGEFNGIVHSYDDIEDKIKKDENFLHSFNDEYFWYYLEKYDPDDELLRKLKDNLLTRKPLRPIYEVRTVETKSEGYHDDKYSYLTKGLIDSTEFVRKLNELGISLDYISIAERKIKFEEIEHEVEIEDLKTVTDEDRLKLVKIKKEDNSLKELVTESGSIVKILSKYKPCIARLYALVDKDSEKEKELKRFIPEFLIKMAS